MILLNKIKNKIMYKNDKINLIYHPIINIINKYKYA